MYKPAKELFEAAVAKADAGLTFDDVLFVTENEATSSPRGRWEYTRSRSVRAGVAVTSRH